jgi:hypothetical protein
MCILDSVPPPPPHLFETRPSECLEGIEPALLVQLFNSPLDSCFHL